MIRLSLAVVFSLACLTSENVAMADAPVGFSVNPGEVRLSGNLARSQIVITRSDASGQIGERSDDLTLSKGQCESRRCTEGDRGHG